MARVIIGLPSLSRGPLLDTAIELKAPVMISASALARWKDDGPVPAGHEFTPIELAMRAKSGDTSPPTQAQQRRRVRLWDGWNLPSLDRVEPLGLEIHCDSAGFVAMALKGGYDWTAEQYIDGLAVHPAINRVSAMDLCVEVEVAHSRDEVRERIAKTVNLNLTCARLARQAGIGSKLMPVIQGQNAEDYIRCFDNISGSVDHGATIGVGSMCRRPTGGPEGSNAILDALDRALPRDVRLHLFGLKSDGAEAACAYGYRVDSIDSQAYGVRARRIANDRRADNPSFSKTNVFVAGVMREWYQGQKARMENPRSFPLQPEMTFGGEMRPAKVIDALEMITRAHFNDLIASCQLDHDQIVGGRMLEESVFEIARDLPDGVKLNDPWKGAGQLPLEIMQEAWFPREIL